MDDRVSSNLRRDAEPALDTAWFQQLARPILFLTLTLACVGIVLAFSIPVSVFPNTDFPRVVIGVDNGVAPIDQMLVTVTRPLEEAVNSVPGLTKVYSTTSRGSAEINLFFDWNQDMFQTLQRVDSAVARVQSELPPTTKIETHRLTFATFPILGYSLTSDIVPQDKLWEIATYDLKPRLNRLDGVSSILVQGGRAPEFHIVPDPAKMLSAGVTVSDVLDSIRRTNLIDSPGLFDNNHQLVLGLVSGQVHTREEIGEIVVKSTASGTPVRVVDIGTVVPAQEPVYTSVTANGKSAVLLSVIRQSNRNTLAVAKEAHALIEQLRGTLPPAVHLDVFYDQSTIVQDSIASVRDAVLIGLVLSAIILVLFLRDWGTSLVAGLVIPVTLALTFIVLKFTGQSFNLMTLGGMAAAVGLVIDDAIVVLENVATHREAGETRVGAVRNALREVTAPLIGSTITPVVVFLPLVFITGVTGSFFRALAITMTAALLMSLVLALTVTPSLSLYLLRSSLKGKEPQSADLSAVSARSSLSSSPPRPFERLLNYYERVLRGTLDRGWYLFAACAIITVLALVCFNFIGTDLLPEMDEGGFILDYYTPPGSSLAESEAILQRIEKILRSLPEVDSTSRRTGLQLGLIAVTEANRGDFTVRLKRNRERGIDEIMDDARRQIEKSEPGTQVEFTQVLQDMIGDLTSAPEPIVIKLFAQDGRLLGENAARVADAIQKVPGVVDVLDGIQNNISGPAVTFQVNPPAAARSGFSVDEVSTDASALIGGAEAAEPVIVNDRAYTIRVRMPQDSRASLERIQNAVFVSPTGKTATLGALATVKQDSGQTEIRRENLRRLVEVTGRLEGVDLGTGIAGVKKAVVDLKLPSAIEIEYGGAYEEQQHSFRDLLGVLFLALLLLFIVLLFEFRTFSAPIAILSSALLSTFGAFVALLVTRTTFNVASFMGMIMVVGIVAKNGILLLDAEHTYRANGLSADEAMVQAGRRRLRPIAMTALAAIAGMLPLAFAIGSGAQMLQPLAIVVVGGLISSMVLSLVVTPAVRYHLSPHSGKDAK